MAMPCVSCGAYTASLAIISYVEGSAGVVRPLCDKCGEERSARDARSIPPQAETGSMQIAKAIVNHATKPLVSAERRREIQLFVDTIKLVENAFHCKLRGDTDLSGDILILDQANPLPAGYEFSAYIEPNGHLEFTEWVLDDEVGIEGRTQ